MENVDLSIEHYNYEEILNIFHIHPKSTAFKENLDMIQEKVNQIKNAMPEPIYLFFLQGRVILETIYALFEKEKVFNASKAAGNLSLWIRAVVDTYEALLVVDPKRQQLAGAEAKLKLAEDTLNEKKKML